MYGMFAFGFWYGGELIQYDGWSVGEMMSCLLCVLIGTTTLSVAMTNLEYFRLSFNKKKIKKKQHEISTK